MADADLTRGLLTNLLENAATRPVQAVLCWCGPRTMTGRC